MRIGSRLIFLNGDEIGICCLISDEPSEERGSLETSVRGSLHRSRNGNRPQLCPPESERDRVKVLCRGNTGRQEEKHKGRRRLYAAPGSPRWEYSPPPAGVGTAG